MRVSKWNRVSVGYADGYKVINLGIGGVCVTASISEEKTRELFCGMKTAILDYFILETTL